MKKFLIAFLTLFCFNAFAQIEEVDIVMVNIVDHGKAVVNVVNKKKGQFKNIEIPIGESAAYEEIVIKVLSCKEKKNTQPNDFWAYVHFKNQDDLFGEKENENADMNLWLSSVSPSLSGIEDDTYEIKLVKCVD